MRPLRDRVRDPISMCNGRIFNVCTPVTIPHNNSGWFSRPIYLVIGWTAVGLGIAGAFLPLVPTTPFLLVALWAFTRSSPAAAKWLRNHPKYGHYVVEWQDRGAIPIRGKIAAATMMAASYAWLALATNALFWVKVLAAAILLVVASYVLTRPSN